MTETIAAPTLSQQAAAWFLDFRLDDAPSELRTDATHRVMDTIGIMLVGSRQPLGASVRRGVLDMGSGNDARLIPFGDLAPAMNAALVHGTLAHATDFDDTHSPTLVHPSGPMVAVALAVGEMVGASGREVLTGVLAGNELSCRLGMVAPLAFHKCGMHPTGILTPLTSALLASRLLGLDTAQAVHAMGIAGSQVSGILESFSDGTWVKTLHPGWAAHAGVCAALLARAGFTGPATVLEGRFGVFRSHVQDQDYPFDYDQITDGLGSHWESRRNSFKPYACAHVIHPFVDLALALHAGGLRPETIERVELPISECYLPVVAEPREVKLHPRTPTHARASLPYCVAAALTLGRLDVAAFEPEFTTDTTILALAERIHPVADPNPAPKGQFRGRIVLETCSGERIERTQEHNRGGQENPMTEQELVSKFRDNARGVLPHAAVTEAAGLCLSLERCDDISRLVDTCVTEK